MPDVSDPGPAPGVDDGPRPAPRVVTWAQQWSARDWATVLHVASLVVGFVVLLWIDRHQWFSGDEWEFLLKRGVLGHSQLGLLAPHNEHWSTAPILIYRAIYSVFGVRTYTPYLVVLFLLQALAAHLLWRVMLRAGVQPLVATGAAAVFMVLGAGWENLVNAFQMSFLGSVAFGLLALLLMPEHGRFERRDVYGWLLNILALTFSGVGIIMVLVTGGVALARRGWRVALAVVSVPGAVYGVWYLGWGRHTQATNLQPQPLVTALRQTPAFIWHGLVGAVEGTTGLAGTGPVLLVLLGIWVVKVARPDREPWSTTLVLALGAPVFLFMTCLRRSGLGVDAAAAPRYVWVVIALLVPLAAVAATRLLDDRPVAVPAGVVTIALLLTVALSTLNTNASSLAPTKEENERRLVAAVELLRSGASVVADRPLPELSPDITNDALLGMARDGKMPDVAIDATDRLNAKAFLQVAQAAGHEPSTLAKGGGTVEGVAGATVAPAAGRPGCVTVSPESASPEVELGFARPGHFSMEPEQSGTFSTRLQAADGTGPLSAPRQWPVMGGDDTTLNVSATDSRLLLTVPASGDTTLCNVASPS